MRNLIDRMIELDFLVEVPPQPHLYGSARRFRKGAGADLETFKAAFKEEIAAYERIRNQERVFQHTG